MKIHSIIALFIVLILGSCTEGAPKPKPFLSEKQMVELLTGIQLTEMALQQLQNEKSHQLDSMYLYANAVYSELFEKYGLSKEVFEANLYYRTYYSRDLEKIYTKVQKNLHLLDSLNQEKVRSLND